MLMHAVGPPCFVDLLVFDGDLVDLKESSGEKSSSRVAAASWFGTSAATGGWGRPFCAVQTYKTRVTISFWGATTT